MDQYLRLKHHHVAIHEQGNLLVGMITEHGG